MGLNLDLGLEPSLLQENNEIWVKSSWSMPTRRVDSQPWKYQPVTNPNMNTKQLRQKSSHLCWEILPKGLKRKLQPIIHNHIMEHFPTISTENLFSLQKCNLRDFLKSQRYQKYTKPLIPKYTLYRNIFNQKDRESIYPKGPQNPKTRTSPRWSLPRNQNCQGFQQNSIFPSKSILNM